MARKKAVLPTDQGDVAQGIAKAAFNSIIKNLRDGGDYGAIHQIPKEIKRLKLSYDHADDAFSFVEMFLKDYVKRQGDDLGERTKVCVDKHLHILHSDAELQQIRNTTSALRKVQRKWANQFIRELEGTSGLDSTKKVNREVKTYLRQGADEAAKRFDRARKIVDDL